MADPRLNALRESLRSYVDRVFTQASTRAPPSNYFAVKFGDYRGGQQDSVNQYYDDLKTLRQYMSNGGAGDVLGVGKGALDRLQKAGAFGQNPDLFLGAMRGMYDDQALMDFAEMNGLNPEGMTPEQFNEVLAQKGFTGADARGAANFFAQLNDPNSPANVERARLRKEQTERDAQSGFMADVQKRLQAFANRMMTYDPNDPTAKAIANVATGTAQAQAYGANTSTDRGLGAFNNASLMNDAATRYQMQREAAGVGALNNLGALAGQNMASAQQRDQFNQNLDFQIQQYNDQGAQAAYQQQQAQRQGVGALVGGGLGAVGGGVAGGLLGGPMGAATGAGLGGQVGSGLGAGIGGMGQRPYVQPSYSRSSGRRFNNF